MKAIAAVLVGAFLLTIVIVAFIAIVGLFAKQPDEVPDQTAERHEDQLTPGQFYRVSTPVTLNVTHIRTESDVTAQGGVSNSVTRKERVPVEIPAGGVIMFERVAAGEPLGRNNYEVIYLTQLGSDKGYIDAEQENQTYTPIERAELETLVGAHTPNARYASAQLRSEASAVPLPSDDKPLEPIESSTNDEWPKKLLAREGGSSSFIPPDELKKVTALWNLAFMRYKYTSTNQEIFDAVLEVLQGRTYYPDLTVTHALNYLIDRGIHSPAIALDDSESVTAVAAIVLTQLQDEYNRQIAEAAEYQQALEENLAESRAAAMERGQSRNQASADRMEAQRSQQLEIQQNARDQAKTDSERLQLRRGLDGTIR